MSAPAQVVNAPVQRPLEILDLRHFAANSLQPVLSAETHVWAERLDWDYRASTNLLLQYLDARVLPGFVAVEEGRVVGYTFCVYEDRKAVIGDVFALSDSRLGYTQTEIEAVLLRHMLSLLQNSPGVERIESQLLLHTHETHADLFRASGFSVYRRTFMELDLHQDLGTPLAVQKRVLAEQGLELRGWHESDFHPAGSVIAKAYEGHLDSTINDQYRSVAGSHKFLHNIIRFPGCGVFDAQSSFVLAHAGSGTLAGLILCSRVREDVQHVTQLCISARARGNGLGTLLLGVAREALAARSFNKLSLTVTAGNDRAAALYRRVGFRDQHAFDAMVWTSLATMDASAPRPPQRGSDRARIIRTGTISSTR